MTAIPDVSVVLPVHNERGHLRTEIERIRRALEASPYTSEIIVVDDGSTDGSSEQLDEIDGIRLFRFDTNRGCGAARQLGTSEAAADIVVWTDVDMTYPNERIPELVALLEGHDQIVGARRNEHGPLRLLRAPVKWLIRRYASWTMATPIADLNSGLRVFRRDVAEQFLPLLPTGFSCVSTLTMTFLANGYSVVYEPVDYGPRSGRGTFHWWRDTRRYLQQVVRLGSRYAPLRASVPAVVGLSVTGAAVLAFGGAWAVAAVAWALSGMVLVAVILVERRVGRRPPTLVAPAGAALRPPAHPGDARGTSPSGPG